MRAGLGLGRLLAAASLAGLLAISGARAQTAGVPASATDSGAGQEIIVTANKRSERLRDVALSITAITGDDLNKQRLVDLQDLSQVVPGLSFQRGSALGPGQRVVLRGLNTGSTNATVASVIDDVPLTASSATSGAGDFAADFDPYDLARVEVLKGPQGTLYGASSLGGLIKYVTALPDTRAVSGGLDAGGLTLRGNWGGFAKGFVNLPLQTDKAAVRVSGYYEDQPGWISNNLAGTRQTNASRRFGARGSFLWTPTPDFTVRATAVYQRREADGYDNVEVRGFADPANPFALLKGYNRDTYVAEPNNAEAQIYSLNLEYRFARARLQSITSYGDLVTTFRADTPFYVPLSELFFGRPNTTLTTDSNNKLRKVNQEFRLASNTDVARIGKGLEWQVGFFYTHEDTDNRTDYFTRDATTGLLVTVPASVGATPPGTPQVFLARNITEFAEYAGYLALTYHFSPKFDFEAGGRVFNNEQAYSQNTGGALLFPPAFQTVGPFRSSETRATFAAAPRFHFSRDVMAYARVSSGYRPGGPNLAVPTAAGPFDTPGTPPTTFGADTTINYEIGTKGAAFGNKLGFDVSAFYIDWSDIQVVQTYRRGFTGYPITLNAGAAVSKGFEWNFSVRPARGFTLGWLGAYTEATLSSDVAALGGTKNAQLPFVPRFTTTLTADLDLPLGERLSFVGGASYAWIDVRRSNFAFDQTRSYIALPAYSVVNAQAGLRSGRFTLQAYGKNLGNARAITNYDPGSVIFGVTLPGTAGIIRPRELGIRASARF